MAATLGGAGGGCARHGRNRHRSVLLQTAELGTRLSGALPGPRPAVTHVTACELPWVADGGGRRKRPRAASSAFGDGDTALPAQRPLLHRTPGPTAGLRPRARSRRTFRHGARHLPALIVLVPLPSAPLSLVSRGLQWLSGGTRRRLKRQTRPGFIVGRRMLCVRVVAAGHMTAASRDPRHRPEVVSPAGPLGYARAGPGQADRPEAPGRTISGLFQLPEVPCPWLKAPCLSSQPAVQPGPSLTQSLPPPSHEDSVRTLGPREPRSVPSHGL